MDLLSKLGIESNMENRRFIAFEINPEYIKMAKERLREVQLSFAVNKKEDYGLPPTDESFKQSLSSSGKPEDVGIHPAIL